MRSQHEIAVMQEIERKARHEAARARRVLRRQTLDEAETKVQREIQGLSRRQKDMCSLLAQGMKASEVSEVTGYSEAYMSVLLRDPAIKAHVRGMNQAVSMRLELAFGKSVDVLIDTLHHGSRADQMRAARLHGELTQRLGPKDGAAAPVVGGTARLEQLAERLTGLLDNKRQGVEIDGTCETVSDGTEL